MINEKQKRAGCIRRKRSNARLKRSDHALFVVGIEDNRWQGYAAPDLLLVMADDNDGVTDRGAGNCIQYVFQKCPAPKGKKRLRPAHSLGFAGGEDDG